MYREQLTVGDTLELEVNYTGTDREWASVQWILSSPAVATISPAGVLVAATPGTSDLVASITSTRGPGQATGSIRVLEPPALVERRTVSVAERACAVQTASGALVCRGDNSLTGLGDGTRINRLALRRVRP